MTYYNWETMPHLPPAIVRDAKGFSHRSVRAVNTDTGEMQRWVKNQLTDEFVVVDGKHIVEHVVVPAPVQVLFARSPVGRDKIDLESFLRSQG